MEVAGFWERLGRLYAGLQSYFCSRAFQRGVGDRQGGRGAVPWLTARGSRDVFAEERARGCLTAEPLWNYPVFPLV